MKKPNRPEYKKVGIQIVHVHVVEIVTSPENGREIEELLEQLQQYSGAQVVERFTVFGTWDENCIVLEGRAL